MMIRSDIHIHTSFSSDCDEPMENQIERAISLGLDTLCFTEHMDKDYPSDPSREKSHLPEFMLDTDAYRAKFLDLKEKYSARIRLLFGVELGLQPHLSKWCADYVSRYDFDYIIGSVHTIGRMDPYYASFFEGRSEREAYEQYFEEALADIKGFYDFDSLGHLDYVVRYGPNKNKEYSYREYADLIDPILVKLIDKGIALEANSAGYRKGLGEPNPCKDVLKRYKELGGQLVTIGSDAHRTDSMCCDFPRLEALLRDCGFRYHAVYIGRTPELHPLG
ncbi:MAG: histidinol-phosphatase HisJ family protein [Lachnospiraceae bacterium]|nr:histidinol-phosphatase HisJ family protein [Lachnospiraceae bacterium]